MTAALRLRRLRSALDLVREPLQCLEALHPDLGKVGGGRLRKAFRAFAESKGTAAAAASFGDGDLNARVQFFGSPLYADYLDVRARALLSLARSSRDVASRKVALDGLTQMFAVRTKTCAKYVCGSGGNTCIMFAVRAEIRALCCGSGENVCTVVCGSD